MYLTLWRSKYKPFTWYRFFAWRPIVTSDKKDGETGLVWLQYAWRWTTNGNDLFVWWDYSVKPEEGPVNLSEV